MANFPGKVSLLIPACAILLSLPASAQSPAEKILLTKAQTLVAHGHLELAIQTWQQILLSDPSQREALLGIARADMQLGKTAEAQSYLQRLRNQGASPADLAQIEAMPHVQPESVRLSEARRLAQQGKSAEAIKIYRDLFPHGPPAGDMALEYYETQAAIPDLRHDATDHLHALSIQFSADPRYAIVLGRILTYDPKTRAQGIALLNHYPSSPEAQQALRQAISWSAAPPKDTTTATNATPEKPEKSGPPVESAADSAQSAAYRALNTGHLDEAEQQFQAILTKEPHDAKALSGLGYVAMKRGNFPDAVDYLEKARAAGAPKLEDSLTTARFWTRMNQAAAEQKAGDAQTAARDYREALALKPASHDAQDALAGALLQAGNRADAVTLLKHEVALGPQNQAAWRNLFLAQAQLGNWRDALETTQRMPQEIKAHLQSDPEYLRYLIQAYTATDRKQDAEATTQRALALPFPDHGRNLPLDTQLQYAGLLMSVHRYEPALRLYRQVLQVDPENAGAWRALVAAQHQLDKDDEAIATLRTMPRAAFDESQKDAGFLSLIGSIYQARGDADNAARYLQKAVALAGESQPALELQLADVYLAQGDQTKAYALYRHQLDRNPNSTDAWRGLLTAMHQSNQDQAALRELAAVPPSVREGLEQDSSFLQTLASIQSAAGHDKLALQTFQRIMEVYVDRQAEAPVDVQIQYGWLLLKSGDERRLYTVVSNLAQAPDLTDLQQTNLNKLWASWSMRRASTALAHGESQRAVAILEMAAQAFPKDVDVYNSLAGAYLQSGQPKRAVAIYASLDLSNASLDQYHGAIGAAEAAHDLKQAEIWLQAALQLYKGDAALLKMAAQYEQAKGDTGRAAAYYRAALEAMGPPSPAELFSHPERPVAAAETARDTTAPTRELMRLLAPPPATAPATTSATTNDNDRTQLRRESEDLSSDRPRAQSATLGDFDPSEADDPAPLPTIAKIAELAPPPPPSSSPGSSSLGDLETAEAWKDKPLPPPPQIERVSLGLPPRETHMQVRETQKKHPAKDEEPAQDLQNAVTHLKSQPDQLDRTDRFANLPPLTTTPTQETTLVATATLPPLTGAILPAQAPKTPREQIEQQLESMQAASSNWMGGTSSIDYRSGQPGFDRLAIYSGQVETSTMLGPNARTTFIVKPVLLDAGQATGTETIRQGTLAVTATPYIQSAAGTAAEFQLQTANFGVRLGTTPRGFLVQNYTGGVSIHPPNAHFNLDLARDPILDTQLSFAGLRDEGTQTATTVGNTWGGVIANSAELQINSGDATAGWYIQGGGQYITGVHVANNERIDGDGGAYWTAWHNPQYGTLVAGMNFFGMHYERNLRYFTYGQGGYFSPGAYLLGAVPLTFTGHYGTRLHYRVMGSLGMQAFQEDSAPYFPLDPVYQAAQANPTYPEKTGVGGNYDLETESSYSIADHWYVGAYASFNNSRDYASDKVGFFVRFLSRTQPAVEENGPTGLFPVQGMRPLQAP